jgi:nucleotide-binding universal stress UspA family protein
VVEQRRFEVSVDTISSMTEMLIPLDGRDASLRSVPVAGRIAKRLGLKLQLFGVSEDPDATREWLASQAERLLPGVDVAVDSSTGDPAEAIIGETGANTLVCMATAATIRPHRGHVGSVAEAVVRGVGRPVLLIGPHVDLAPGTAIDRVIVPVDGSDLSEQALRVAGDFAKTLGVTAWVVSVIPPKVEAASAQLHRAAILARESGYVRSIADDLAAEHGISTGFEVLHIKDPAKAILDFAGDDGAVVMSTHGRSGLSRLFAGSVARGVVAASSRPVVVYRPSESK